MAEWDVHVPEQDFMVTAGTLDRAEVRAKNKAIIEVSPHVQEPPPPEPLRIPRTHGELLFFDDLLREDFSDRADVHSPTSYGDPGPNEYVRPVLGPSEFRSPWGEPAGGVVCITPDDLESKYDRLHGPTSTVQARTALYYERDEFVFPEGKMLGAYLAFRQQENQADVFPRDVADGGGNHLHSQLCQLKTWEGDGEPDAHFFAVSQGRNGIKTSFAQNRLGDELLIPLPVARWYLLGIEGYWTYRSGGWLQLWINDQDPRVMRPIGPKVTMAAGSMRTERGTTRFCFGTYHQLKNTEGGRLVPTEFWEAGDVLTQYAYPCVYELA